MEWEPCDPEAEERGDSCDDTLPLTLPHPLMYCQLSETSDREFVMGRTRM